MISPAELADLREEAERSLPSICNVISVTRSRDDRGQVAEAYLTGPDFRCAVDPIPSEEVEAMARLGIVEGWRVAMPLSVIIAAEDRLIFDVEGEVHYVEVVGGARPPQSDASLRTVLVREAP